MAQGFPNLTPEQRAAALAKATQVRRAQSAVKHKLAAGEVTLPQVLAQAETDEVLAKMKVFQLIRAVPKIGPAKARIIMDQCAIAEIRRVSGLTDRQRAALIEAFAD